MKRTGFIIDVVVGSEYERMSVVDPRSGMILFEGDIPSATEFLNAQINNFKNSTNDESN